MDKQITKIEVKLYGTAKGKRKVTFHGEQIAELDGHLTMTGDDLIATYAAQAYEVASRYKNVKCLQLWLRHGWNKGSHITLIKSLPELTVLI